jgi:hypothetical protein
MGVGVRDHRELHVWRLADDVRRRVWRLAGHAAFDEHR